MYRQVVSELLDRFLSDEAVMTIAGLEEALILSCAATEPFTV